MILATQGLGKRYGPAGFRAVADVTLRIGAGEFVSIIGRSGSGKSTLLAMLGALTRPSEGEVTLDGTDIWSMGEDELAAFRARQIGFIFQFPSLLPNLSALDNVALPALLSNALDTEAAYVRAHGLLANVGLADRLDYFPAMLSGGEQRRAAIARALINAPRLLLADEPTSDLDEASEAEIVALLDRLRHEQGFGLLVVSHNLDIARRAGRSYEMSRGQLLSADLAPQPDLAPAPPRLRPIPTPEPLTARKERRLGANFWPIARLLLFGGAVAFSLVMLTDSLVGHYQRLLVQERAEKLAALETLALSALRANVKSIASLGNGSYELSLELWNVKGDNRCSRSPAGSPTAMCSRPSPRTIRSYCRTTCTCASSMRCWSAPTACRATNCSSAPTATTSISSRGTLTTATSNARSSSTAPRRFGSRCRRISGGDYTACSNTQAIMAMPITPTNQASVRSHGMPIK